LKSVDRAKGIAKFNIYSNKISVEVKIGEIKEIDLDGDEISDVILKLNSISEDRVAVDLDLSEVNEAEDNLIVKEEVGEITDLSSEAGENHYLWLLVLALVVLGVVGYFVWKKFYKK